jgi:pyruvate-formate lyase
MSAKVTKLTVGELCQLNTELNTEKGLLSERLPMVFKYHLSKVAKIAAEEQASVDKLRDDTIRSLGTPTAEGGFSILQFIETDKKGKKNMVPNPAYLNFVGEMENLLKEEKDVDHEEFFIADLKNVESGENFPVFFKLLEA